MARPTCGLILLSNLGALGVSGERSLTSPFSNCCLGPHYFPALLPARGLVWFGLLFWQVFVFGHWTLALYCTVP